MCHDTIHIRVDLAILNICLRIHACMCTCGYMPIHVSTKACSCPSLYTYVRACSYMYAIILTPLIWKHIVHVNISSAKDQRSEHTNVNKQSNKRTLQSSKPQSACKRYENMRVTQKQYTNNPSPPRLAHPLTHNTHV